MNNNKLALIKKRIGNIQSGLLRYEDKKEQITLQVKITANEDNSLNCILTDECIQSLVDKNVHLIQKYHDHYLHIGGKVTEETEKNNRILAVQIKRICWFIRKSRGNISWLQQKYLYEALDIINEKKTEVRA